MTGAQEKEAPPGCPGGAQETRGADLVDVTTASDATDRLALRGPAARIVAATLDDEFATTAETDPEAARIAQKALSSLQAEFALAGHELVPLADDSLMVSRWGMVRPLASMDDARKWLQRVTGDGGPLRTSNVRGVL
jgi:hypothetical protein